MTRTISRATLVFTALNAAAVFSDSRHNDDASAAAGEEAFMQKTIVSTSVQDYLTQISQMEVHNPTIAIPGEWLTDAKKTFVFLPIRIPQTLPLDEVKLLTDGRSLLVNVVERVAQPPEDASTKKFRLVLDAFKAEANGNDKAMEDKLQQWASSEDDPKVQDLIRQSLDSLEQNDGRHPPVPKALTIPLDGVELSELRSQIATARSPRTLLQKKAADKNGIAISNPLGGTATLPLRSTYLQQAAKTNDEPAGGFGGYGGDDPNLITVPLNSQFLQELEKSADYVVPLNDKDAFSSLGTKAGDQSYIKESFSVVLPYPTATGRIFAVLQTKGQIVLCMPYDKSGKAATAPFSRVPIFDEQGQKLTGPGDNKAMELSPETREVVKEVKDTKEVKKAKSTAAVPAHSAKPKAKTSIKKESATPRKLISIGDF